MATAVLGAVARAVSWTAGVVGGFVGGRAGPGGAYPARLGGSYDVQAGGPEFRALRRAILGRRRGQIAGALGVPPAACSAPGASSTCAGAATWYYPFDQGGRQAIAIRFVGERARAVEWIGV